jgi:hypothetical protein
MGKFARKTLRDRAHDIARLLAARDEYITSSPTWKPAAAARD